MSDEWELVATPYSEIPLQPEPRLRTAGRIGLPGWRVVDAMREVLRQYDMELLPDGRSTAKVLWLAMIRAEREYEASDE